jgi:predicted nuclease with TOPRIM domain
VLLFLALVHSGYCLLSGNHDNTTASPLHGQVSGGSGGTPLDGNIIRDILTQETALRMKLQKDVDTMMKDLEALKESTSNEIMSLKQNASFLSQEASSLEQEVSNISTEKTKLRQRVEFLNSSCFQDCQNRGAPETVPGEVLSSLGDLKSEVRYLTLSLLTLQKEVTSTVRGKYDLVYNDIENRAFNKFS